MELFTFWNEQYDGFTHDIAITQSFSIFLDMLGEILVRIVLF